MSHYPFPFLLRYASILLASLHEHNGVRYVRYKDLANSIAGKYASWSVVAFQQIASLGNNITLGIVAGERVARSGARSVARSGGEAAVVPAIRPVAD